MSTTINFGIIGLGMIAKTFATGLRDSTHCTLTAVASRDQSKANAFGKEFGAVKCYDNYQALLDDEDVDAVYIATPHPQHPEWAIKAARAGKHILCEKPLGINAHQAMAIIEAAKENDVYLMEAFMYRCHPQTAKLIELIREKAIGEVKHIEAVFAFNAPVPPEHRLVNNDLGGGGILDVGCYPVSLSRLVAGVANGGEIAEPLEVQAVGSLGETGVDVYTTAAVKYPGDITATLTTGVHLNMGGHVRIYGSDGKIELSDPWIPAKEGGDVNIVVTKQGEKPETIVISSNKHLYAYEADMLAENIANRQAVFPAMTHADTMGNMKTLDLWRAAIGLTYNQEKAENQVKTLTNEPLAVCPGNVMKFAEVPYVDQPVSKLVLGCMDFLNPSKAAIMYDEFIRRGGNTFDTAHIYGGGEPEKVLGHYLKNRNYRKKANIIGKGAHSPYCYPEKLTEQLLESLDRMQTDYVDIYLMHRDNLEVPVGEFVDVLNEHVAAGRIKCFGGSNWTLERIDEANQYALANGKQPFAALSNNYSLARFVQAIWPGCLACSSPEFKQWLIDKQVANFAWSSQAQGFFADRGDPSNTGDKEMNTIWFAEDNFKRRERAMELAVKRGVTPTTIALAYVLQQDFPSFALIGPRDISEMKASFAALEVELSAAEMAWLNLED